MWRVLFFLFFIVSVKSVGQSPNPGNIDLSFNSGEGLIAADDELFAVAYQNDGKIIIGGRMTSYGGIRRKGIARLNADGSLDTTFDPGSGFLGEHPWDSFVQAITVQADGKILVGGDFISYDGVISKKLVRLNPDGTRDASFNIGAGFSGTAPIEMVMSIAIQSDGRILIAGVFEKCDGKDCFNIARLNSDGTLDNSFNMGNGVSGFLKSVVVRNDGKIIIAGKFSQYNNQLIKDIVLLNNDGTVDKSFNSPVGFDASVEALIVQTDNKIVTVGSFGKYGDLTAMGIARLNSDGTLDGTFNAENGFLFGNANGYLNDLTIQSDGKIIVVGYFDTYLWESANFIARLNTDGSIDNSFNTELGLNSYANKIMLLPSQKTLIVGNFSSYKGVTRERITQINSDASLDESFNSNDKNHLDRGTSGLPAVMSVSSQSDGKIIAAGSFSTYFGFSRRGIIRFNNNGSIDSNFNPTIDFTESVIRDILLQPDGKIIASGFIKPGNLTLVRFNTDGSLDQTFPSGSGFNASIYSLAIQQDGKILVGGYFSEFSGTPTMKLARLNVDGTIDNTFNVGSGFDQEVECIVVQADGKIICGGTFTSVQGSSKNRLVRLNSDGSIDHTFDVGTGLTNRVFTLTVQPDNKIIVGGIFTSYNGMDCGNVVRLMPNGSIDNSFLQGTGFDYGVSSVVLTKKGNILFGGYFTKYNGVPQGGFALLNGNGELNTSFQSGSAFDGQISSIAIQDDGNIIVGGTFYQYDQTECSHIIRVVGDRFEPPQNVIAETISENQINLSWNSVIGADQYVIERSSPDDTNFMRIDTVSAIEYVDDRLERNQQYYYRISAGTIDEFSSPSVVVAAKTALISGISTSDDLLIYPNPNRGIFSISFSSMLIVNDIRLFNSTGTEESVKITNENDNKVTLNIQELPNGLYFLKIYTESLVRYIKLLKN